MLGVDLRHPAFDVWIGVRLRVFDGSWLAVADVSDSPQVGKGESLDDPLTGATEPFGLSLQEDLVARAGLDQPTTVHHDRR